MSTNVKSIIQRLKDEGFDTCSYSGRGMYGKRCVSVYIRPNEIWKEADVRDLIGKAPTTDSMGKGIVAYWPDLTWPEDMNDEPEDEEDD